MPLSDFSEKNGILTTTVGDCIGFKLSKPIVLKNFYMDLFKLLSTNGFVDFIGTKKEISEGKFFGNYVKPGEVNNSTTRRCCLYEKSFQLSKNKIASEFVISWKAYVKTEYSEHGWLEYELSFANRFMQDREVLNGNEKKVFQTGTWEFKNKFTYKNSMPRDYLNKIPYIKDSPKLKSFYMGAFFEEVLDRELKFCSDGPVKLVNDFFEKYFQ